MICYVIVARMTVNERTKGKAGECVEKTGHLHTVGENVN